MIATSPIRLLIVDDHSIVRDAMVTMLNTKPNMQVVGQAGNGLEAIVRAAEIAPDVILMDVRMPEMDGIEATRLIREANPEARILVLSSYDDDAHIIDAIQAGAVGYMLKEDSSDALIAAIHKIHDGDTPANVIVAETLLRQLAKRDEREASTPHDLLTDRELEVACLLASGATNAQIAEQLGIRERTVGTHVSKAMRKLNLENRTQLALYILREGLAPLYPDDEKAG